MFHQQQNVQYKCPVLGESDRYFESYPNLELLVVICDIQLKYNVFKNTLCICQKHIYFKNEIRLNRCKY